MASVGIAFRRLQSQDCLSFTLDRRRNYRADVTISLLGVPIFSRQGVGSAFASLREAFLDGRRIVSLQFAGGANPERTHGIQYFGSTEEVIQQNAAGAVEAGCFGFVTARHANQEGLEQARQRLLAAGSSGRPSVTVVEERVHAGMLKNASATLPTENLALQDWQELARQMRSAFQRTDVVKKEASFPAGSSTFLYAVLSAIRARGKGSLTCMHNAKPYRLDFDMTPGLRLTGRIHDLTKDHTSTFRLWLEEGSDLPVRIEFSPTPYLRIALEADAAVEIGNGREDVCREASFTFSGANARR